MQLGQLVQLYMYANGGSRTTNAATGDDDSKNIKVSSSLLVTMMAITTQYAAAKQEEEALFQSPSLSSSFWFVEFGRLYWPMAYPPVIHDCPNGLCNLPCNNKVFLKQVKCHASQCLPIFYPRWYPKWQKRIGIDVVVMLESDGVQNDLVLKKFVDKSRGQKSDASVCTSRP